jgi:ketopantoate reductase
MRIAIVGAGAMGSSFGACLHRAGHHVTLVALVRGVEARARRGADVDEARLEVLAKTQEKALK